LIGTIGGVVAMEGLKAKGFHLVLYSVPIRILLAFQPSAIVKTSL